MTAFGDYEVLIYGTPNELAEAVKAMRDRHYDVHGSMQAVPSDKFDTGIAFCQAMIRRQRPVARPYKVLQFKYSFKNNDFTIWLNDQHDNGLRFVAELSQGYYLFERFI